MKSLSVTMQMKATEHYFPVVLFIMLYKVVLPFESGGNRAVLFYGADRFSSAFFFCFQLEVLNGLTLYSRDFTIVQRVAAIHSWP